MDHVSVLNPWLVNRVVKVGHGVLHPGVIKSVREVVSSVGSSGLLSVFGSEHGHLGLNHKVVELHGLDQISVPDVASITDADVGDALGDFVERLASLLEVVLSAEDGGVFLHRPLHVESDVGRGRLALGESQSVQVGDRLLTSVG